MRGRCGGLDDGRVVAVEVVPASGEECVDLALYAAEQHLPDRSLYLHESMPIGATAHQAGSVRFGTDPESSALDVNCRAHDVDNLYVVHTSFFSSIGTVNPSLTAIANALGIGDDIAERLR